MNSPHPTAAILVEAIEDWQLLEQDIRAVGGYGVVSQFDIGQAGESSHPHPHAEVLTLREARRDVVRVGIASDADPPRPEALRGTVTGLRLALARIPLVQ